MRRAAAPALAALAALLLLGAAGGVYTRTRHGSATDGVSRLPEAPVGDCTQCHAAHGDGGAAGLAYALFAANENQLCGSAGCHPGASASGGYQGLAAFSGASHGTSAQAVWPGPTPPARPGADQGKCLNCHTPHGAADGAGLIPSLAVAREEALCLGCHDGSPAATNVAASLSKTYRHPVSSAAIHAPSEGGAPASYGYGAPSERHSECADCHAPHVSSAASHAPGADGVVPASGRLAGVSGIRAGSAPAGATRPFAWIAPGSTLYHAAGQAGVGAEFDLCYKCHSAWTTLPPGKPDISKLLNPANASFHPVEARGKNQNILPAAFTGGMAATSTLTCSSCHGDVSGPSGPHGSSSRGLLRAPLGVATDRRAMAPDEICFLCHRFDTYANDLSSDTVKEASRFNRPIEVRGHTFHVGQQFVPCETCHAAHGSASWPHLLYNRPAAQVEGIESYTESSSGGSCLPSCHGLEFYEINYPR